MRNPTRGKQTAMKRIYRGWKIRLYTSAYAAPYVTLVSPDGKDWPQPWIEGKDELDMLEHIKQRIDKIIALEDNAPE